MVIDFLLTLNPETRKYIIKIILGKMRLNFSDMTILDAFSWMTNQDKSCRKDLEDVYNV